MNKAYKVDIVLPVYYRNVDILEESTTRILEHVREIQGPYSFKIIISINGPHAKEIIAKASTLCRNHDSVVHIATERPGKGQGVISAWKYSSADILVYMDIDLATSLESFRSIINEIRGGADIAVGSRYLAKSKIERTLLRYTLSRIYHTFLINIFLRLPYKDVQCGFKAIDKNAFKQLVPYLLDDAFFFEAEMLYFAHRRKMKIVEVPVFWTECTVSGVRLLRTSVLFLCGVIHLKLRGG